MGMGGLVCAFASAAGAQKLTEKQRAFACCRSASAGLINLRGFGDDRVSAGDFRGVLFAFDSVQSVAQAWVALGTGEASPGPIDFGEGAG